MEVESMTDKSRAVLANDNEIESTSALPPRQRIIPRKFRDFCDVDAMKKEEAEEVDYCPTSLAIKPKPRGRPKGRPRKVAKNDHAYPNAPSECNTNVQTKTGSLIRLGNGPLMNDASIISSGKFACSVEGCHNVFLNSRTLKKHLRTMHSDDGMEVRVGRAPAGLNISKSRPFKCSQCDRSFTQKGSLKTHLLIHSNSKPHVCDVQGCGKSFRCVTSLRTHKMSHLGIKPYKCTVCMKNFSSNAVLKEHMALHTDSHLYTCHVCQRPFRQASALKRHLTTHFEDKPFQCEVCAKQFALRTYLNSHMKTHTGERPFSCKVCGKRFSHKSDLNRHMITHSGTKPFECSVCGARFSDSSACRRHCREHEDGQPIRCRVCPDTFKRVSQWRMHMKRKHSRIIKPEQPMQLQVVEQILQDKSQESPEPIKVRIVHDDLAQVVEIQYQCLDEQTENENRQEVVVAESHDQETNQAQELQEQIDPVLDIEQKQVEVPLAQEAVFEDNAVHPTIINTDESQSTQIMLQSADGAIIAEDLEENENDQAAEELNVTVTPEVYLFSNGVDYVAEPDFKSQEYFCWLAVFADWAKQQSIPLQVEVFQKMSQVHKSLSDAMANPSGAIMERENFVSLMKISSDFNEVIQAHLSHVLSSLPESTQ